MTHKTWGAILHDIRKAHEHDIDTTPDYSAAKKVALEIRKTIQSSGEMCIRDRRESNLFDRFYKSWRGIEVAYEKIASDCGVTTNVMYILTLLYKNCEPMTQNELSKELHLSKQTVTSVVDSLEKRGWVTRSIDPNDRRNRIVTLTESGRETGRHIGRTCLLYTSRCV